MNGCCQPSFHKSLSHLYEMNARVSYLNSRQCGPLECSIDGTLLACTFDKTRCSQLQESEVGNSSLYTNLLAVRLWLCICTPIFDVSAIHNPHIGPFIGSALTRRTHCAHSVHSSNTNIHGQSETPRESAQQTTLSQIHRAEHQETPTQPAWYIESACQSSDYTQLVKEGRESSSEA